MALLVDSFSDALNQDNFLIKVVVYSVPVFLCANLYLSNNMAAFYFLTFFTTILLIALLSHGIYNITNNKREILTFNFLSLFATIVKLLFTVAFYFSILFVIGFIFLKYVRFPVDNENFQTYYNYFVIYFLFSIGFTPYLAFSKTLDIRDAYKFSLIYESSMDILIAILFLVPQFLILDAALVGLVWYVFWVFKIPINSPIFIFYCSFLVVLNVSALASYLAQIAYTCIRGEDEDYRDSYYIKANTEMNDKNRG